ncbi:DUF3563 domain-containing protein [Agrobacterium sp. ES01]|uniref:DUF3563 domain-containing protein n=1 Tax=Agrobacterium sp. ES01 TaxID=3420714 RepID=UPI003D13A81B
MFGPIRKFARAFRIPSVDELETQYLNNSFDRVDLEHRQRQVDRGMFRRHNF